MEKVLEGGRGSDVFLKETKMHCIRSFCIAQCGSIGSMHLLIVFMSLLINSLVRARVDEFMIHDHEVV